jgi:hypothetical protein
MAAFRKHVAGQSGIGGDDSSGNGNVNGSSGIGVHVTPRGLSEGQILHATKGGSSIIKHLRGGLPTGLVPHTRLPNSPQTPSNIWLKNVFDTPRGTQVGGNGDMSVVFGQGLSVDIEGAPQLPTPTITSRPESTLYRDSLHFDFSETIRGMAGSPTNEGIHKAGENHSSSTFSSLSSNMSSNL